MEGESFKIYVHVSGKCDVAIFPAEQSNQDNAPTRRHARTMPGRTRRRSAGFGITVQRQLNNVSHLCL